MEEKNDWEGYVYDKSDGDTIENYDIKAASLFLNITPTTQPSPSISEDEALEILRKIFTYEYDESRDFDLNDYVFKVIKKSN